MASQPTPNPETQRSWLRIMKALTTAPAQVLFYGSALLAIAATGGASLPGVLGVLSTTVGMNILSNMLERVTRGEDVADDEIRKTMEEAILATGIENLLTSREFQRVTAHVFRQFDLLKYAVQRGEITIVAALSDQFVQHKSMLEEMQSELSIVNEKIDTLATREQGEEILKFVQYIPELSEIRQEVRAISQMKTPQETDREISKLLYVLSDEAREGPRLFSLVPLDHGNFNPKNWVRAQFRLILWCEHSRLPLPVLNNGNMKIGVYDIEIDHEWFAKAVPYLKLITGTLRLVLPVASSTLKVMDDATFRKLEDQLDLGKDVIDAIVGKEPDFIDLAEATDSTTLTHGVAIRAENATLRELHALLKARDPGFGNLVRVMNKRNEFLWVHEKFAGEY